MSPESHCDCGKVLQIGAERARAADLQQRVAQTQQRVDEQRRQMGGVRAAQDCDIQARPSCLEKEKKSKTMALLSRPIMLWP